MFCLKYQNMVKYIMKPSSLSFASKGRRAGIEVHRIIRETLNKNRPQSHDEWNKLREFLLTSERITKVNVDGIILGNITPAQLDVGKSYMKYLKESGIEPTTSSIMLLLTLYYKASKIGIQIQNSDEEYIIDMYKHFVEKFPVFHSTLSESVIYGLLLTKDWRTSLELMDSLKYLSKTPVAVYSAIIRRAAEEQDEDLVWKLLIAMVAECQVLNDDVFVSYITCFCEKNSDTFTNINKMLTFIKDNEILVSSQIVTAFQRVFQSFGHTCTTTSVTKQGKCHSCNKYLRSIQDATDLTDDEFNLLSDHFCNKVFIGSDIFQKSTPEEVASFTTFIERSKPFDCVIDGLNVACSSITTHPSTASKNLASVVKHFVDKKKAILVIGRKHMGRWPEAEMEYIRYNSHLFLTENLSEDDQFFLYATLMSGPKTELISRDLIRDHALKVDKNLKIIFRRWQLLRQHKVQRIYDNGKVVFVRPMEFDMSAHQVDGCWHIPYDNDKQCSFRQNFDLQRSWLCVSNLGQR